MSFNDLQWPPKTERQKDRKTERQKDRKTERQKDRKTDAIFILDDLVNIKKMRQKWICPLKRKKTFRVGEPRQRGWASVSNSCSHKVVRRHDEWKLRDPRLKNLIYSSLCDSYQSERKVNDLYHTYNYIHIPAEIWYNGYVTNWTNPLSQCKRCN